MKRLILWLIKKRFDLKWTERFRFTNQKSPDIYWFEKCGLYKIEYRTTHSGKLQPMSICESSVSLNWLLDKECQIEKVTEVI